VLFITLFPDFLTLILSFQWREYSSCQFITYLELKFKFRWCNAQLVTTIGEKLEAVRFH